MLRRKDIAYMYDIKEARLRHTHPLPHVLLFLILAFFISAVIWANFAVVEEVTTGMGQVIPSGHVQVIQNLEGGILAELMVREGEEVDKGQVLLKIDDTGFDATRRENQARKAALVAAVMRLAAQAEGSRLVVTTKGLSRKEAEKAIAFPDWLVKGNKTLVMAEMALYRAQVKTHEDQMQSMRRSLALTREELNMKRPLVERGVVSKVEVLQLQRQVNELQGKLDEQENTFRSRAAQQLSEKKNELDRLEEAMVSTEDRVKRALVRSPVRGTVKRINVTTIGGVIKPGMDIMEVVPLDDSLVVEAKVKPTDIAFITPGQKATVKVTAYDFSVYGGLDGKVEHISADTIADPGGRAEPYYLVRVRTKRNFLEKHGVKLPIKPGMTASVDILTGTKTVLDYLVRPFLKARYSALRER